jgi:serine/threonine protein kinase
MSPNPLPSGTKLNNGAFVIGKVLGSGGFGITYYSGDMALRRYIAIKEFFPPDCTRNGSQIIASHSADFLQAKNKFIEEARTLAQFNHSSIVKVLNVFEDNGTAYMVMEFLKGKTLQHHIEEFGRYKQMESEALKYVRQIGEALQTIHEVQIIHRDIKPENIILCEDGRVVLIDFGLNKKIEVAGNYQTRQLSTTKQLGTDGYSPPEQYLRNAQTGIFTDVYSLGATMYFALTGQAPISAPQRAMGEILEAPQEVNPFVSHAIGDAVMSAMAIDSGQRPQTVEDFLVQLETKAAVPQMSTPHTKRSGSVSLDYHLSTTSQTNTFSPLSQTNTSQQKWDRCPNCSVMNSHSLEFCNACRAALPWAPQFSNTSITYAPNSIHKTNFTSHPSSQAPNVQLQKSERFRQSSIHEIRSRAELHVQKDKIVTPPNDPLKTIGFGLWIGIMCFNIPNIGIVLGLLCWIIAAVIAFWQPQDFNEQQVSELCIRWQGMIEGNCPICQKHIWYVIPNDKCTFTCPLCQRALLYDYGTVTPNQ